jgi:hypothetical protein
MHGYLHLAIHNYSVHQKPWLIEVLMNMCIYTRWAEDY